jgi:antitoxin (DNA-binding transcriptional repressor) of toxin-antitoxin stability system
MGGGSNSIDPTAPLHYPKSMKVSAQYAATHFDDILSAATSGEEVEIAVPDKPTLKLVVANPSANTTSRRILGAGRGELRVPTPEEWAEMDKELEQLMNAKFTSQGSH